MKLLGRILMILSVIGSSLFFVAVYAHKTRVTRLHPALIGLARTLLAMGGWRIEGSVPDIPKMVMIAAPHTSYWDGPIMLATAFALDFKLDWLVKDSVFKGPFGPLMRLIGGIAVDRSRKNNLVDQVVQTIAERDEIILTVAPEGKRAKMDYWKSGFYRIAEDANVPLVFGFLDYKNKVAGIGPMLYPSGDIEADMLIIKDFYSQIGGKYPELVGEIRLRGEQA